MSAITKEQISSWLLAWFQRKAAGRLIQPANCSESYFELGWIDSFGVIELIADIEKEFNIKFNAVHFQDRRFSTVAGLSEIIKETMI